ncbi:MAG TPA: ATP synthase F1 subunit gamma [Caldithrix abyssi]|uniref:ATP synthase gamma chain n=1 Tax=Caldithrix abyssi TaxID=187145 RepID=A0A7V1LPU6_CALAY|nr:ATP synthase F1 subunit gamma [Caldithrix abyssi]
MATLREIRQRISSVKTTQQITKAMKMVAAAKMRRAQENILAIRPYANEINGLIHHIAESGEDKFENPLMQSRPVEKVLLVVVTADRGLCGAFNSNIIRTTESVFTKYSQNAEVELYTIGRKASEYFGKRAYPIYKQKAGIFHGLNFERALEISRDVVSAYQSSVFDRVIFIYNEFKSAIAQNLREEVFLPFVAEEPENTALRDYNEYIYEPDKQSILNALIPKHLNVQVWRILLESNAAEQGARMTAMDNATENAEEIKSKLTLYYNRARQAAITTEISEIVGGAEALKES